MSILVIGGDNISPIVSVLNKLGVTSIKHWSARDKNSVVKKSLPKNIDCLVFLTNFLSHGVMYKFKKEAKKRSLPFVCADRNENRIHCAFCKKFGIDEGGCGVTRGD